MNWKLLGTMVTLIGVGASVALGQGTTPTIVQGDYISNVFGNSNFVQNPNAKLNATTGVAVSSATVTRSTTTPLVATSEFNITTSTSTGYADWSLRAFDAGMKNNNCEARFTYRGFSVGSTTAQILQGANVVAQLTLTASTDPRIASINFPCGDLSAVTKFRLQQASASLTGTNEIGAIYVGLATNQANVAQAENVVQAWRATTSQTIGSGGSATTVVFNTEGLDVYGEFDTSTGIFTAKRAGNYLVNFQLGTDFVSWGTNTYMEGVLYKNSTEIQRYYQLSQTTTSQRFWIVGQQTVTLAVGDTLKVTVFHNRGANTDLIGQRDFTSFNISRFPSSSELVVKPETQNVFGGVKYTNQTQSIRAGQAASATYYEFNNATWNQPSLLIGKAAVTTTGSGNDLGFSIPNLPVGSYKVSARGAFVADTNGALTVGQSTHCSWKIRETTIGTDVALQVHKDSVAATTPVTSRDFPNMFFGVFNNTSVGTRNFRIEAAKILDGVTSNNGACQAYSNSGVLNTELVLLLEPLDQPSNSALYVQGPILGAQTGAAIPSGYVFEELTGTNSADFSYVASTTANAASITLQPGIYLLVGQVRLTMNTGSDYSTDNLISISDTSATYDSEAAIREISPAAGGSNRWQRIQRIVRVTTANKVWYLTAVYFSGGGTVRHVNNNNTSLKAYRLN